PLRLDVQAPVQFVDTFRIFGIEVGGEQLLELGQLLGDVLGVALDVLRGGRQQALHGLITHDGLELQHVLRPERQTPGPSRNLELSGSTRHLARAGRSVASDAACDPMPTGHHWRSNLRTACQRPAEAWSSSWWTWAISVP